MDECQTLSQSGKTAKDLSPSGVRLEYFVYPGHPLISAYLILRVFNKLDEAATVTHHGWYEAESRSELPGAGGVASEAVDCLRNYRKYKDLSVLIAELHAYWIRLTGPRSGNFEKRFLEGLTKAMELERDFINLVVEKEKEGFFNESV